MCAGEASGDILAGAVIRAWRDQQPHLALRGIGGPHMEATGFNSQCPMDRLSVMGLVEPLKRLPELLRIRRELIAQQQAWAPQLFLGIDSPDFNLEVERRLRAAGIPTAHLVSPSVWAWRKGRIRGIRQSVDRMLCLLPFEVTIYQDAHIDAVCVGHPLVDELRNMPGKDQVRRTLSLPSEKTVVAVLPGSREAEVRHLMPIFAQTMVHLQQSDRSLGFLVPAATGEVERLIKSVLRDAALDVTVVSGMGREAMRASDAVLIASGTATLEAMLMGKPMVIAYRMAALSWHIMSRMVKTPYVGLPNILAGRLVAPEYLQQDATPENLATAIAQILDDGGNEQTAVFEEIASQIGGRFAERVVEALLPLTEGE
jgi:lipid-A-disaccharide synthase